MSEFTRLASSQWLKNPECRTPADVMYVFDVTDVMAFEPTSVEKWPAMLTMVGPSSPLWGDYACGNLQVFPMDGDCCLSSVSRGQQIGFWMGSGEYSSGSVNLDLSLQSFTKESNGHLYCSLNATTRLEPSPIDGNLFGWARIYYLAQSSKGSGVCIDDSVKCFDNGTLFVYPDLQCQGVPTAVQLSDAIQPFEDDILGSVTGQIIVPRTGQTKYFWTTMQPWNMVVSHPEAGFWQGFEVGAIVFAFSAYIYILYFSLTAWKRHRSFAIGLIVSQSLLSLFSLSINVLLSYYAFPDPDTTLVPMALNDYFLALNSLLSAFFTANAIIVLTELSNPWNKLLYLLIAVIHFVMQGESYFNFMWNMANDSWVQSSIFTHDFLHQWALLEKYYLVLIHLWNTIPGPLMFLRIGLTRTKSLFGAFGYVMEQNHWFLPALVLRIIAIASGYTIDQIRVTSNWLGSDTNASSFGSLHYVTNSLKFMTHLYLLESVRQVVSRPVSHSHWSGQTIKTREYKESIALEAKH